MKEAYPKGWLGRFRLMPFRRTGNPTMFDAFTAWSRLMSAGFEMGRMGFRVADTMAASNSVIARRSDVIGAAMRNPGKADYAELGRMVPEKVEAFSRSGSAVVSEYWSMQTALFREMQNIGAMVMRGRLPTPGEVDALSSRGSAYAVGAIEQAVAMGGAALAPVHARATANARRLRRR
jgi:hypothetical protein